MTDKCEKCDGDLTKGWLCNEKESCLYCEKCTPKCKECCDPIDKHGDAIVGVGRNWDSSCEDEPCEYCETSCDTCGRKFCGDGC